MFKDRECSAPLGQWSNNHFTWSVERSSCFAEGQGVRSTISCNLLIISPPTALIRKQVKPPETPSRILSETVRLTSPRPAGSCTPTWRTVRDSACCLHPCAQGCDHRGPWLKRPHGDLRSDTRTPGDQAASGQQPGAQAGICRNGKRTLGGLCASASGRLQECSVALLQKQERFEETWFWPSGRGVETYLLYSHH